MKNSGSKGKKMSFDQYHTKLSQKKPISKAQNTKQNSKIVSSVNAGIKSHQQYVNRQKPLSSQTTKNESNNKYPKESQYFQKQSGHNNRNQVQQDGHRQIDNIESVSLPVSYTKTNKTESESESVKKIDLIFEKEPQQVQNKLRMLLLNYNAVMQYNHEDDRFEVDLLLPFQSVEEQQAFVQRFHKTRRTIKEKMQMQAQLRDKLDHNMNQQHNHQMQNQERGKSESQPENGAQENQHEDNQNTEEETVNRQNNTFQSCELEEVTKEQDMVQENDINFSQLSYSLDQSIKRAMSLIYHKKLFPTQKEQEAIAKNNSKYQQIQKFSHQKSALNQNQKQDTKMKIRHVSQHQKSSKQFESQKQLKSQKQFKSQKDLLDNETNLNQIQDTRNQNKKTSFHDQNSQYKNSPFPEGTQMYSQAQQSISSFDYACQPQQINYNSNHQYLSNNSYKEQTNKIKKIDLSSHLINKKPQLNNTYSNDFANKKPQISNPYSNQILIEDQLNNNQNIHSPSKIYEYQNPIQYESSCFSQPYHEQFIMIEESSQEQEDQSYISPSDYQLFLQNKINSINQNQPNKEYSSLTNSTYKNKIISSFKKDYDQFLKRNRTKIQNIYQRIGKYISKNDTKKSVLPQKNKPNPNLLILQESDETNQNKIQSGTLQDFKRRIILENQSMSSEDKVRYFRYLAKNAKKLYIDFIKNQGPKTKL